MYTRRIVGTKTDLLFSSTLSCTTVGGFLFCTVWQAKYRCLRVCSVLSVLLLLPSSFPENNHSSRVSHTRRKRHSRKGGKKRAQFFSWHSPACSSSVAAAAGGGPLLRFRLASSSAIHLVDMLFFLMIASTGCRFFAASEKGSAFPDRLSEDGEIFRPTNSVIIFLSGPTDR